MSAKAIIISGPTSVGKTDLAVHLARRLNGELISCDSVQVYKHLEIGANKDRFEEPPQHLIDLVELDETFTAADFYERCHECMREVVNRGKVPILVGGTGFYMDWLVRGRPTAPPTIPSVMQQVDEELSALPSWNEKYRLLERADSEYAKGLLENDVYRLKRALCVVRQTGRPISSFPRSTPISYDWCCFYLTADREELGRRIDRRCEAMIKAGLVRETLDLLSNGKLLRDSPPGRAIGYQETIEFLDDLRNGQHTQGEAVELFRGYLGKFQASTRQYSRRQEIWFRRMPEFKWIQRAHLDEDFTEAFLDDLIKWYNLSDAEFQVDTELTAMDRETRGKITGNAKDNRKRMKTYASQRVIYQSEDDIRQLLQNLSLL